MPLRRPSCLASLALALLVPATVRAQVPEKFENLQVLPKDIARDSLTQVMRGFSFALGVRCTYCHVGTDGPGGRMQFALDEKTEKKQARYMMRMADSINRVLLAALPERSDPPVRVDCVTCHRGLSTPATLESTLLATAERAGADSVVLQYRALRADMTSGRWNFGEWSVNELARKLAARGKTAEAIALLQVNQEHYPNSASIDQQIAEAHLARGERDQAIARFRAALAKQPRNQAVRRRLEELGAAP